MVDLSRDNITRFSSLIGQDAVQQGGTQPAEPQDGQFYFDASINVIWIYNSLKGQWMYGAYTTTTSTSTSTTTTSTSTTTTSTSTSTTTSTTTSTSTSTTTTL